MKIMGGITIVLLVALIVIVLVVPQKITLEGNTGTVRYFGAKDEDDSPTAAATTTPV